MLNYMGKNKVAEKIENAWLDTIEDGIHTADICDEETTQKKVSTSEFAEAVISRLGQSPKKFAKVEYPEESKKIQVSLSQHPAVEKTLDGVDIFIAFEQRDPNLLGEKLVGATKESRLNLEMITNRGVKVYPKGNPLTFCTDHWRCRFTNTEGQSLQGRDLVELQRAIVEAGLEIIKTENLYTFGEEKGYSLGQGQ